MGARRQKSQLMLAFPDEGRGEAPSASEGGTEAPRAMRGTERPAGTERLRLAPGRTA
jgi:hypothetical protein